MKSLCDAAMKGCTNKATYAVTWLGVTNRYCAKHAKPYRKDSDMSVVKL